MRLDFLKLYDGVRTDVLFEEEDASGGITGFTREYIKVRSTLGSHICGSIKEGILTLDNKVGGLENFVMI
jgi:hypothetical protein